MASSPLAALHGSNGSNTINFTDENENNSNLSQMNLLQSKLLNSRIIGNSGRDSNGSYGACGFMAIYGLRATREGTISRLLMNNNPYINEPILNKMEESILNYFSTQRFLNTNFILGRLYQEYQIRLNHAIQQRKEYVQQSFIPLLLPYWSEQDKRYSDAHNFGQLKPDTDVLGYVDKIIRQNQNQAELVEAHNVFKDFNDAIRNIKLFDQNVGDDMSKVLMYSTLLGQEGYFLFDCDLDILSILDNICIVRVNDTRESQLEPIRVFNPNGRRDNEQDLPYFIKFGNQHYQKIKVNRSELSRGDQIALSSIISNFTIDDVNDQIRPNLNNRGSPGRANQNFRSNESSSSSGDMSMQFEPQSDDKNPSLNGENEWQKVGVKTSPAEEMRNFFSNRRDSQHQMTMRSQSSKNKRVKYSNKFGILDPGSADLEMEKEDESDPEMVSNTQSSNDENDGGYRNDSSYESKRKRDESKRPKRKRDESKRPSKRPKRKRDESKRPKRNRDQSKRPKQNRKVKLTVDRSKRQKKAKNQNTGRKVSVEQAKRRKIGEDQNIGNERKRKRENEKCECCPKSDYCLKKALEKDAQRFEKYIQSNIPKVTCPVCDHFLAEKDMSKAKYKIKNKMFNILRERDKELQANYPVNFFKHPLLDQKKNQIINICKLCEENLKKGKLPTFSINNDLNFGPMPEELEKLNTAEKILIQKYRTLSLIVQLGKHGTTVKFGKSAHIDNSGFVNVAKSLPRKPCDTDIVFVRIVDKNKAEVISDEQKNKIKVNLRNILQIRPNVVNDALNWLIKNHPSYATYRVAGVDDDWQKDWNQESDIIELKANSDENSEGKKVSKGDDDEGCDKTTLDECCPQYLLSVGNDEIDNRISVGKEIDKLIGNKIPSHGNDGSTTARNTTNMNTQSDNHEFLSPHHIEDFYEGSFPWLFPYGVGGPINTNRRKETLSAQKWNNHILSLSSHKFERDFEFLFVRASEMFHSKASVLMYRCNKNDEHKKHIDSKLLSHIRDYTKKKDVENAIKGIEKEILDKLSTYGSILKGTGTLDMKIERNYLWARIGCVDLPCVTWFVTLSNADKFIPDLYKLLRPELSDEEIFNLTYEERCDMLSQNPVLACKLYKDRLDGMVKHVIRGKGQPLGRILHDWIRTDFQARGGPHGHIMLWAFLKDLEGNEFDGDELIDLMTSQEETDKTKLAEILDQYIECEFDKDAIPDGIKFDESLGWDVPMIEQTDQNHGSRYPREERGSDNFKHDKMRLLRSVNIHSKTHVKSCFENNNKKCRFRFPRKLHINSAMRKVPRNYKINNKKHYDLRFVPKRNSAYLNDHNEQLIMVSRQNNDVQLITGPRATGAYCTAKYVTKSDVPDNDKVVFSAAMLRSIAEAAISEDNLLGRSKELQKVLFVYTLDILEMGRQYSITQAAWSLLNYPLVSSSCKLVPINLSAFGKNKNKDSYIPITRNFLKKMDEDHTKNLMEDNNYVNANWFTLNNHEHDQQPEDIYNAMNKHNDQENLNLSMANNEGDDDNNLCEDSHSDSESDQSEYVNRIKTDKTTQEYMDLDPASFKKRGKDFSLYEFCAWYKYSPRFLENDTNETGFDTNTESNSDFDEFEDSDARAQRKKRSKIFSAPEVEEYLYNTNKTRHYYRLKQPRVLFLKPWIKLDPSSIEGAWALLQLYHTFYTSIEELGLYKESVEMFQACIRDNEICSLYKTNCEKEAKQNRGLDRISKFNHEGNYSTDDNDRDSNSGEKNQCENDNDDSNNSDKSYDFDADYHDLDDVHYTWSEDISSEDDLQVEDEYIASEYLKIPGIHIVDSSKYKRYHNFIQKFKEQSQIAKQEYIAENIFSNNQGAIDNRLFTIIKQLRESYQELSLQQRNVIDVVTAFLTKNECITSELVQSRKDPKMQLRCFISGEAGTGKTYTIDVIQKICRLLFSSNKRDSTFGSCITATVSGKAASNLNNAMTISHAFSLQFTSKFKSDDIQIGKKSNAIQKNLRDVEIVILDEASMIGLEMWANIDMVLRIAKNEPTKVFGGVHMIAFGDLYQLGAIKDKNVYSKLSEREYQKAKQKTGNHIWKDYIDLYYELTDQLRQTSQTKDDVAFLRCLRHIRKGKADVNDLNFLKTKSYQFKTEATTHDGIPSIEMKDKNISKTISNMKQSKTLCVAGKNTVVNDYNAAKLKEQVQRDNKEINIWAQHEPPTNSSKIMKNRLKIPSEELLTPHIQLTIGSRVMLTRNLSTPELVNGSLGILKQIVYDKRDFLKHKIDPSVRTLNEAASKRLALPILVIEFDDVSRNNVRKICERMPEYTDLTQSENGEHILIAIGPTEELLSKKKSENLGGSQIKRVQIPVIPAASLTTHKSQGMTVDNILINMRNHTNFARGLLYVSMSRPKKASGLYILLPREKRINKILTQNTEITLKDLNTHQEDIKNINTEYKRLESIGTFKNILSSIRERDDCNPFQDFIRVFNLMD